MKRKLSNKSLKQEDKLQRWPLPITRTLSIIVVSTLLLFTRCGRTDDRQHEHAAEAGKQTTQEDLSTLLKSPNEVVLGSVKTIRGEFTSLPVSVEATGVVTYDSRKIYSVPARVEGRLEKVFVKYAYQRLRKGQRVADIYSPELLTAQRELLFLLENDPGNQSLIEAAERRLSLLGLTSAQIRKIAEQRELQTTFAVYSPYDGYVLPRGLSAPGSQPMKAPAGGGMTGMGGPSAVSFGPEAPATTASSSLIRSGDYIAAGETMFQVVNPAALRIELDIPADRAKAIKTGDPVTLALDENRHVTATVDFVLPFYSEGQNFVKLWIYNEDTKNLRPGELVRATIRLGSTEGLWVPREAVLDLGIRQVVFVRDRDALKPREITAGTRTEKWIEVKSGLATSEEIAANAHYLVDGESFIKPNE